MKKYILITSAVITVCLSLYAGKAAAQSKSTTLSLTVTNLTGSPIDGLVIHTRNWNHKIVSCTPSTPPPFTTSTGLNTSRITFSGGVLQAGSAIKVTVQVNKDKASISHFTWIKNGMIIGSSAVMSAVATHGKSPYMLINLVEVKVNRKVNSVKVIEPAGWRVKNITGEVVQLAGGNITKGKRFKTEIYVKGHNGPTQTVGWSWYYDRPSPPARIKLARSIPVYCSNPTGLQSSALKVSADKQFDDIQPIPPSPFTSVSGLGSKTVTFSGATLASHAGCGNSEGVVQFDFPYSPTSGDINYSLLWTPVNPGLAVDGDLIFSHPNSLSASVFDPWLGRFKNFIKTSLPPLNTAMAANNQDLILALTHDPWITNMNKSAIVRLDARNIQTTLASQASALTGLELDHDDKWLLTMFERSNTLATTHLRTLGNTDLQMTTLFTQKQTRKETFYRAILVDRDPGAPPYVIGILSYPISPGTPLLLGADRTGVITTILSVPSLAVLNDANLDPGSGDYLICDPKAGLCLVSKSGAVRVLLPFPGCIGAVFNQDGTAWVTNKRGATGVFKIDMKGNTTTMHGLSTAWPYGVEVYGSRRLVVNGIGKPGSSVAVTLQSRRPGDGGKDYMLACSYSRRPGIVFPNSERLDLAIDPLFFTSAFGLAPDTFIGFQGKTDSYGNAHASVAIPPDLAPGLGITVFVGGIIQNASGGVLTVTNTHWFVLN